MMIIVTIIMITLSVPFCSFLGKVLMLLSATAKQVVAFEVPGDGYGSTMAVAGWGRKFGEQFIRANDL